MIYRILNFKNNCKEIIIKNEAGMILTLLNLGATIKNIMVPNKKGRVESIVMHPIHLKDYYKSPSYYGKTIGRVAGRINLGKYTINGLEVNLDLNDNNHNCLHGGNNAISEKVWDYKVKKEIDYIEVIFSIVAKDDGFNGESNIMVIYKVYNKKNIIEITYLSESNEDTLINLTNHAYFNLSGFGRSNVLNHLLKINASKYTVLDDYLITTEITDVNEEMDFRSLKEVGKDINVGSLKNHPAYGYDHFFIFDEVNNEIPQVELIEPNSKRRLRIYTDYTGVVLYSCNYPRGEEVQNNRCISLHDSVCLECQHIPNAINMDNFKDLTIQKANKIYENKIKFVFDTI